MSLSSEIGIISVLSLVICIPVFTNAVLSKVLEQELTAKAAQNHRGLFSIHSYYRDDTTYTPLTLKNARYLSEWMDRQISTAMGLTVKETFLETMTEATLLFPE